MAVLLWKPGSRNHSLLSLASALQQHLTLPVLLKHYSNLSFHHLWPSSFCVWVSSHRLFPFVYILSILFSYEDTAHIGLRITLMTLLVTALYEQIYYFQIRLHLKVLCIKITTFHLKNQPSAVDVCCIIQTTTFVKVQWYAFIVNVFGLVSSWCCPIHTAK